MRSLLSLPIIRVWLSADHLAVTAKFVMAGHKVPALGVVDELRNLIGWITPEDLAKATETSKLGDIMSPIPMVLKGDFSIREAADALVSSEQDFLPISLEGKYVGVVTARQLLGRLRESWDPLTELPWSDALREWGVAKLSEGIEIAVLFIDLNQFGQFNKNYGHVVGDHVLQRVAEHLRGHIDPAQDFLVRYGGDEFAVGTIRERDEAVELANDFYGDGSGLMIEDAPVPIKFSMGIYGGRRTKERTNVHLYATLDNLINFASRDCQKNKPNALDTYEQVIPSPTSDSASEVQAITSNFENESTVTSPVEVPAQVQTEELVTAEPLLRVLEPSKEPPAPRTPSVQPPLNRPVIETIQRDDEPNSLTYVVLRVNDKLHVGVGIKMGTSGSDSVAYATSKALEKAYEGNFVQIDDVEIVQAGSTELVTVKVRINDGAFERSVTAQSEANGDLDITIAAAVVEAFFAEQNSHQML